MSQSEILDSDLLFVSFRDANLDDDGNIKPELFRLPDFSCNWSRFSEPGDVRHRVNGRLTDGCMGLLVMDVKYKNFAAPVHDPECGTEPENYSHCEVRIIPNGLKSGEEPPRNYKKGGKELRNEWRKQVILKSKILIRSKA